MRAEREVLAQTYGPLPPLMLENATSLDTLKNQRRDQLISALAYLRSQRAKAVTQEKQFGERAGCLRP